jgi:hypothetical protein
MRSVLATVALLASTALYAHAQAPGKWPPDSLINLKVIPPGTSVTQVIGMMRNFAGGLGVRCQFCHLGEEGMPLERFDFASDDKRTKQVARQMMHMVQEINRRVDTIPERPTPGVQVTCATCHHGVSRPVPLNQLMTEATLAFGADSAVRNYRALRDRYFGRDAYDFSEFSLNSAALRVGREQKFEDAFALLRLNEEFFPQAASVPIVRGNISLIRGDTTAAAVAFREAIRRDSTNNEARSRLRDIGQQP